jgi:hypothetical protein
MSFQEKSTWIMLAVGTAVYGWYFVTVFSKFGSQDVADIDYSSAMLVAVISLVVLAAIAFSLVALSSPAESDVSDERDRSINRYGGYIGGFVLATGSLAAMLLAMLEAEYFWIANSLLLALVVSELTAGGVKITLYRRGEMRW